MSSPYLYSIHEPLFNDAVITSTPTSPSALLQSMATSHESTAWSEHTDVDNTPASPNGISAATILTSLSENRPPAGQGENEEELDEDQSGGILLTEDYQAAATDHLPALSASQASTHGLAQMGAMYTPSSFAQWLANAEGTLHDALDQHAVSFESLGVPASSAAATLAPSIADQLLALPNLTPTHAYELEQELTAWYEDSGSLNVREHGGFLDISHFYRYFINPPTNRAVIGLEGTKRPAIITREDLRGDEYDFQGIDWSLRHISRDTVRARRVAFEKSRTHPVLRSRRESIPATRKNENFFLFRQMKTRNQAIFPHFQLRNLLASTSENDIFYATINQVQRTDPSGLCENTVMDLSREKTEGLHVSISTLAASDGVLVAGGFEGEYWLTNLMTNFDTGYIRGRVTDRSRNAPSHITNHTHVFSSRNSYTPQVAFCSNDNYLRILDCNTNIFTHAFAYPQAVNCSATSPNGRMRVVVGDFFETLITNAETGQAFETLRTHSDGVFACDWADDGIHVATAAQDTSIAIWDARKWHEPLRVLRSELSIPRCLKFSPVGSGPRVLISAEADDYVSIINAQTYDSRQVFDFFGRTAGISMTPDGSSLFLAASEEYFGGLMQFERCNLSERSSRSFTKNPYTMADWLDEEEMDIDPRVICGWQERQRRDLGLGDVVV